MNHKLTDLETGKETLDLTPLVGVVESKKPRKLKFDKGNSHYEKLIDYVGEVLTLEESYEEDLVHKAQYQVTEENEMIVLTEVL